VRANNRLALIYSRISFLARVHPSGESGWNLQYYVRNQQSKIPGRPTGEQSQESGPLRPTTPLPHPPGSLEGARGRCAQGQAEHIERQAGIHLFVEKPLSLKSAEEVGRLAEELGRQQERHGLVIAVGYMLRYSPAVQGAKKLLKQYNAKPASIMAR